MVSHEIRPVLNSLIEIITNCVDGNNFMTDNNITAAATATSPKDSLTNLYRLPRCLFITKNIKKPELFGMYINSPRSDKSANSSMINNRNWVTACALSLQSPLYEKYNDQTIINAFISVFSYMAFVIQTSAMMMTTDDTTTAAAATTWIIEQLRSRPNKTLTKLQFVPSVKKSIKKSADSNNLTTIQTTPQPNGTPVEIMKAIVLELGGFVDVARLQSKPVNKVVKKNKKIPLPDRKTRKRVRSLSGSSSSSNSSSTPASYSSDDDTVNVKVQLDH